MPASFEKQYSNSPEKTLLYFWNRVQKTDGCWLWTGRLDPNGYGRLRSSNEQVMAHRFSYELVNGQIQDGLCLDHVCRVRACVRPDHLEPVTLAENVLRGLGLPARNSRKSRCIRGHEFTAENTQLKLGKTGNIERSCRTCRRDYVRSSKKTHRVHTVRSEDLARFLEAPKQVVRPDEMPRGYKHLSHFLTKLARRLGFRAKTRRMEGGSMLVTTFRERS